MIVNETDISEVRAISYISVAFITFIQHKLMPKIMITAENSNALLKGLRLEQDYGTAVGH